LDGIYDNAGRGFGRGDDGKNGHNGKDGQNGKNDPEGGKPPNFVVEAVTS
jgi:hypothetical protein